LPVGQALVLAALDRGDGALGILDPKSRALIIAEIELRLGIGVDAWRAARRKLERAGLPRGDPLFAGPSAATLTVVRALMSSVSSSAQCAASLSR
jgi:hypothetical protein